MTFSVNNNRTKLTQITNGILKNLFIYFSTDLAVVRLKQKNDIFSDNNRKKLTQITNGILKKSHYFFI